MNIVKTLVPLIIIGISFTGLSQNSGMNAETIQPPSNEGEISLQQDKVNLSQIQKQYNKNSDQIPDYTRHIIGDQTITVNLTQLETGTESLEEDIISVKTNGVKTQDIKYGQFGETTLKIWITEENVQTLQQSRDLPKELNKMMKNDELRYETYTLGNHIKFGLVEIFSSIL